MAAAREHARRFLLDADPGLPAATVQDVLLAVSEMVTNAVRLAPGACGLEIALDERRIRIGVTDTSRNPPVTRPAQFDGSGGFGLHLLRELAGGAEGVQTVRHPGGGKTVSVSLDRMSHSSRRSATRPG